MAKKQAAKKVVKQAVKVCVDWHGWRIADRSLHVGLVPARKQPCLYMVEGNRITILAYFATEQKAAKALLALDELVTYPLKAFDAQQAVCCSVAAKMRTTEGVPVIEMKRRSGRRIGA